MRSMGGGLAAAAAFSFKKIACNFFFRRLTVDR
jgi:hypothetical protein